MAILLTLLTFLLFISISYLRRHREEAATASSPLWGFTRPFAPEVVREHGFEIPQGYCFHPGHTWVLDEGRQNARMGLDSFAGNLLGKIDRIEVTGLNRWVRQGQKVWTVTRDGLSVDMLSPVEGMVMGVNPHVLEDPNLVARDPYGEGWVLVVKSPDLPINLNNLVKGSLVRVWMQNTLDRLREMTAQLAPALAQDGGLPIAGLLGRLEPGLGRRMVKEFFLT
jgi:glycine cleavage system H lipoate-binding protein